MERQRLKLSEHEVGNDHATWQLDDELGRIPTAPGLRPIRSTLPRNTVFVEPAFIDARKGRGLRALRGAPEGSCLEEAVALVVESSLSIREYLFTDCERPLPVEVGASPGDSWVLIFGAMSLANHSDNPNAAVEFYWCESTGLRARLVAIRQIQRHEEVTIRYPDRFEYDF